MSFGQRMQETRVGGKFDIERREERLKAFLAPPADDDRPSPQTDVFT